MVVWKFLKFKADADKVYDEIQSIGESATPQQILDFAKSESTELHKCFTWDDTEAAEKWRLQEARFIVCNLVFEEKDETKPVIRAIQLGDSGYTPVKLIIQKKDEYQRLLDRAYGELRAFKQRYKMLTELEAILELIE